MWLAIGLMIAGLIAIIVEFFVPAGGLVGILGVASIVGGVVMMYMQYGNTLGSIFLILALVLVPALVVFYFKVFPRTFMGKRLILGEEQKREGGYASYTEKRYADLVGKMGTALTVLRPSGMISIDRQKFSVVTAGEFIDQDKPVKVVKVEGSRIVVREGG